MNLHGEKLGRRRKAPPARPSAEAARRRPSGTSRIAGPAGGALDELLSELGACIWEADPRTGVLTYVSPQIATLLGRPAAHWIGRTAAFAEAVHAEDRPHVPSAVSDLAVPCERTYRVMAPDGRTRWVRETIRLAGGGDGAARLRGTLVDVTETREAERVRQTLEEQLRQAQKMEAVGRLASGIAHDFNNLLTAILGYSELVLDELPGRPAESGLPSGDAPLDSPHAARRTLLAMKADIEEIVRAGRSATALTRQLLAFSRKQVLQPTTLDLNEIVGAMDKMLRRLIGEDVELATVLDADLWKVKADPALLEQVIVNLAVNARDAMPRGGRLTIETANVVLDETYSRAHMGMPPGRYALMAVSDTGIGMDKATLARVFEPFFTTKEAGKGTGLGLSTVYGIVKQSNGYIWAYSEPNVGTTFKTYLPAVEEPSEAVLADFGEPGLPAGTETILVVEDEDPVRSVACEGLRRGGYNVIDARTAEEALLLLEQYRGEVHLLLTDVVLPGISGPVLARRARGRRPALAVLFMSGYSDNAIVHHQMLEPGTAFLQKPFTPQSLNLKVREVLARAHS